MDGFIGPRIVSRPRARSHASAAAKSGAQALSRRGKERGGSFGIVAAFEESEKADAIVVKRIVRAILDGGDAPDRLSVAQREEELARGISIKRIALGVERIAHGDAQRRHPLRMLTMIIDLPREIYKATKVAR